MNTNFGRKTWIFPDGDRPREGNYPHKGHESLIILNCTDTLAKIHMTVYFTDKEPASDIMLEVGARRVRCFRTNNLEDMCGLELKYAEQYAVKLESNTEIVVQYGKLETSDQPMAYYTVMGYSN